MKRTVLSFGTALSLMLVLSAPVYAEAANDTAQAADSIDYSDQNNWAFWDHGEDKEADLFIVCPTVDMGKGGNYNSDITNEKIRGNFVGALNMELGIYTDTAAVYSPYYRQATFPVYSLDAAEREQYMQIAYDDVRDAFLYYADNCDESRPLILAGFSQGSDMVIRLMTEFFDDEKYSDRLVAAYTIGWSLTEEQTAQYPWLKPAQGEDDTGVIIMFNSEAEHITSSLMVGENEHTYAINPLNWMTDSTPADKSLNNGACFTDYSGNITSEVPELTGAYIDGKRGTLKVPDISEADYPAAIFDEGIYHIYDYQFFFRNLQDNVAERTAAFLDNNTVEAGEYDVGQDTSENSEKDISKGIVNVSASSENVTIRIAGGLVPMSAYHVIFFTYEKTEDGESLTRAGSDFPTEPGTYIAAVVADENSGFTGENRSDPFTVEPAAETNPKTGAELTGLAVLAISAAAVAFTVKRRHKVKHNYRRK